ncbi:MAG: hypothetical protein EOP88_06905 [Verrucomicrobiaceae bacterium]|nr:MAG: hypothetical protein EOP88_06905 [Verrucomicrobiaceae bacterium]
MTAVHPQERIIMSHFRDPAGSRSRDRVVVDIIDGRPWNARHVRNNSLRQHCRLLAKTFRTPCPEPTPMARAARQLFGHVHHSSVLLTSVHPKELQVVPALVRMAHYHEWWIRDPSDWTPDPSRSPRLQIHDLAAHLFARWPMPEWFGAAWFVKGELTYLERDWYCQVGRGSSLRKLAGMPPSITHRALSLARNAPGHLTVREALRWGQVKAAGGTDELLREVLQSRMVKDLSNDAVWSRLIGKFAAAKPRSERHFGIIADTLIEVIRNDGWHRAGELVGLPFGELLRHCRKFWSTIFTLAAASLPEMKGLDIGCRHARAQFGAVASTRWARLPYVRDQQIDRKETSTLEIVELTTLAQLIAEGRSMGHCVGTYGPDCVSGGSSIFRMRRSDGERPDVWAEGNLTIEVDRASRRVIQIRGKYNRSPTFGELRMIRSWAAGSRLSA